MILAAVTAAWAAVVGGEAVTEAWVAVVGEEAANCWVSHSNNPRTGCQKKK